MSTNFMSKSQTSLQHRGTHGSHGGHCVCQICTCNKHKCPPGMMSYPPDALKSTFKNDYPAHPLNIAQSNKKNYQYQPTNYSPDMMKTTHQNDFTPKKVNQPYKHQREEPVVNNVPFNGESEYKTNYLKNQSPQISKQTHKVQQPMATVPFTGSSTYTDNYKGDQVRSRPAQRQQPQTSINVPFEGNSTYKQEYKQYEIPKNQSSKKEPIQQAKVPFEGHTSYQDEYQRYKQGSYEKDPCPIYSLPQVPRNCSPGKNHVHYHDDTHKWD